MEQKGFVQLSQQNKKNYMKAVAGLYGDQLVEVNFKKTKRIKSGKLSEFSHQIKLIGWLIKQGIKFTASANGEKRDARTGYKLKLMGVSKGFPDIEIPLPNVIYHGLYIEMKRDEKSIITTEQQEWLDYLNSKNYLAVVARSFEEAKKIVEDYLAMMPDAA